MLLADTADIPGADLDVPLTAWVFLLALIVGLLLLDLFVVNRKAHEISFREAIISSAVWITIGLAFGGLVWWQFGGDAATQYYTAYVIEKSLSVDNVFVWAVILGYFAVPKAYQHRVLFWGVFGALILRAAFIFAGVALLNRLEWLVFVFGAFLVFTGIRVATHDEGDIEPERNPVLRWTRRHVPMTDSYHGSHFFIFENAKRYATPLFAVLVLIEFTDVVFAVDSIPAVLGVSRSQFIVFSSNAFALLGLRALYFVLAGAKDRLVYLNQGLGIILGAVGVKMLIEPWVHIETWMSLAFIVIVLTITVVVSLRAQPEDPVGHAIADALAEASKEADADGAGASADGEPPIS